MKKLVILILLIAACFARGEDYKHASKVQAYFDKYNSAVAETPYSGSTPRQFSWVKKVTAFDRDGWKCVVCGATNDLEMDHAVALMNGGCNEISNLCCLCHSCHVAKTRLDFELRRHRKQLARSLKDKPQATESPATPGG